MLAVSESFAEDISPKDMENFEQKLYSYFEENQKDIKGKLETGEKMDEGLKAEVKAAISSFKEEM